jgi:hypothetical protein
MPTSVISKVTNQTHELALRFFIFKDKKETTDSERERIRRDNLKFQRKKVDDRNSTITRPLNELNR